MLVPFSRNCQKFWKEESLSSFILNTLKIHSLELGSPTIYCFLLLGACVYVYWVWVLKSKYWLLIHKWPYPDQSSTSPLYLDIKQSFGVRFCSGDCLLKRIVKKSIGGKKLWTMQFSQIHPPPSCTSSTGKVGVVEVRLTEACVQRLQCATVPPASAASSVPGTWKRKRKKGTPPVNSHISWTLHMGALTAVSHLYLQQLCI